MLFFVSILIFCLLGSLFLLTRKGLLVVNVLGPSMAPTFKHGDRVLILRRGLVRRLHQGHVVVLKHPTGAFTSDAWYIKRIVALGGETFVLPSPTMPKTYHVPPGHVFVCGDNRADSEDSRYWGAVPLQKVGGVVLLKLKSTAHLGAEKPLPKQAVPPPFMAQTRDDDVEFFDLHPLT